MENISNPIISRKDRRKTVKFDEPPKLSNVRLKLCEECIETKNKRRIYSNFDDNIYCIHEFLKQGVQNICTLKLD